jgi:hypothetical protein
VLRRCDGEEIMAKSNGSTESVRHAVRRIASSLLAAAPEGLRYSELLQRLRAELPSVKPSNLPSALVTFASDLPREIVKPSHGLYRHIRFAEADATPPAAGAAVTDATNVARVSESQFYAPFADWLMHDVEECTRAIPLGGNVFRDKWGTPDVIGVRKARESDIIRFPTEIVAAEVKTSGTELITAFGQACAYRLFSHKAYLVVPMSSSEEDVARLDVLSRLFGIGLVLFDAASPADARFSIRVRASKHEPDGFYVNKCLKKVERQLFE